VSFSGPVLPLIRERRNWLYFAFGAAAIVHMIAPAGASPADSRIVVALLLPLTAVIVARLTQRDMWHRVAGVGLIGLALVQTARAGSQSPQALMDPLFWALTATIALVASTATGRWPVAAALTAALAGAAAMVASLLPLAPDVGSTFPSLTPATARAAVAALSQQIGVPATVFLFGFWLQAIAIDGPRGGRRTERVSAAARGALGAGLLLTLAGAAAGNALNPAWILVLGLLLGLAEAKARTAIARIDWGPLWQRANPAHWRPITLLLLAELLFALLLLRAPGTGDVSFFVRWSDTILTHGLAEGYRLNDAEYPPVTSIVFLLVARTALAASTTLFLGVKLSLVAFLFLATVCFWRWTSDVLLTALLASSFLVSGVSLGYIDLYFAPTLILSLWALQRRRLGLFSVLFAVTCLIKWQPLIIAPFLVLHAVSIRSGAEVSRPSLAARWALVVGPALAVGLLILAIFGLEPVIGSLYKVLFTRTYLSGTAFNFSWLVTYYLHVAHPEQYGPLADGVVTLVHVGRQLPWVQLIRLAFVGFYLAALWRLFRDRASYAMAIECALAGYLAYFVVNVGVHENHLFLGTVLAAAAAALAAGKRARALLIVLMSNLNLITVYGITGAPLGFAPVVGIDVTVIFAAVNVLLFLVFWGEVVSPRTLFSSRTLESAQPAYSRAPGRPDSRRRRSSRYWRKQRGENA